MLPPYLPGLDPPVSKVGREIGGSFTRLEFGLETTYRDLNDSYNKRNQGYLFTASHYCYSAIFIESVPLLSNAVSKQLHFTHVG